MYFVEVDIGTTKLSVRNSAISRLPYNSSTASCMGIGSSSPRPIISHEKVASRPRSRFSIICGSGMVFVAMLSNICGSSLEVEVILEIGSVKGESSTSGTDEYSRPSGIDGCPNIWGASAGRGGMSAAVPGRKLEEKSVSASGSRNEFFGSLDLAFLLYFVLWSWVSTWAIRREIYQLGVSCMEETVY